MLSLDRIVTLGDTIGRGASASVYRGTIEGPFRLRRAVAVKVFDVLPSEHREAVLGAIARVARRAAFVRHPNVAAIYDLGFVGNAQPVVVSELVDGPSLAALVDAYAAANRRFPPDLALFIACEIVEAFTGARDALTPEGERVHLVHLGVSARDVLLSQAGEVKLTDFGVAAALQPGSGVRSLRALVRRAATLAPEVARGEAADARSDVFAVGIVLREMLVGRRFPADIPEGEALRLARDGYVDTPMFEPKLPEALSAVIRRALEVDPRDRWPHVATMGFELRRVCLSMGVGDARVFLRSALAEMLPGSFYDPDTTAPARMPPVSGFTLGADEPSGPNLDAWTESEAAADGRNVHRVTRPDRDET